MPHIHHIQHSRDGVGVGSGAELEYVGSGAELEYVRGSHEVVISESTNGIGGGVELESMPTVVTKNSSWLDSGSVPTATTKKSSVYRRCGVIETPMGMPSSWLLDGEVRIYMRITPVAAISQWTPSHMHKYMSKDFVIGRPRSASVTTACDGREVIISRGRRQERS
uniref:Uncharacterized protein n=1 Tax=Oryza glumipatula TaxID=40148 RepID=A0A0E0B063_9ORYZ